MLWSLWKSGLVVALLALGLVGVCGGDDKSDLEARVEQLETQIKTLLAGALRMYLTFLCFYNPCKYSKTPILETPI